MKGLECSHKARPAPSKIQLSHGHGPKESVKMARGTSISLYKMIEVDIL